MNGTADLPRKVRWRASALAPTARGWKWRRGKRLLLGTGGLLLGTCLLSACAPDLGPAPMLATSRTYAAGKSLLSGNRAWPNDDWWRAFGDPQLDQLVEAAIATSPTMAQATARVAIAKSKIVAARAALLPTLNAIGAVQDTRISENIGLPSKGDWNWLGAGLLQGTFEIDFWGKNRSALEAASSASRSTEADAAAARLALAADVASTYCDFARLLIDRRLAADALRIKKESLGLVQHRLLAGTAPKQALEEAEAGVQLAKEQLAAVDESVELARHAIAALLGAGPDRGDQIAAPRLLNRPPPGLPDDVPLELAGRNPSLVAARWRAEAAASRIHVAEAAYYPNVNLIAVFGVVSMGLGRLVQEGSELGSMGPAVSLPIFDGGRLEAGYEGARGEYDLAVANYNEALVQTLRSAADAIASLKALRERSRAADAAEKRAGLAYALIKDRFKGGLADYESVLISEDTFIKARKQAAELRVRGFALSIALTRALGGGYGAQAQDARSNG